MSADPDPSVTAFGDALRALIAASPAQQRLLEWLELLDAGRAVAILDHLADSSLSLARAVRQESFREDGAAADELSEASCAFSDRHGTLGRPPCPLGHIGWPEVVDDLPTLRRRYGFSSTRSIETFTELLRHVSDGIGSFIRVLTASAQVLTARQTTALEPLPDQESLSQSITREIDAWKSSLQSLTRASEIIESIARRSDDFDVQRRELSDRAETESDARVARLLSEIARVRSPRAWLVRSRESRLAALRVAGDDRLELGFADGTYVEIELGPDYWNTTGLDMDGELFRSVRIDRATNRLVWSNGFSDPGERLHDAILSGRVGTLIDPIDTVAIVPGRSIGPFELGMTRQQVRAIATGPRRSHDETSDHFPLVVATEAELDEIQLPRPGVTVSYDSAGRCVKLDAIFSWAVEPPVFTLLGEVVNGMSLEQATHLIDTLASDARIGYGSVSSDAAGVSACKWEASDDAIMNVSVTPPRPGPLPGGSSDVGRPAS